MEMRHLASIQEFQDLDNAIVFKHSATCPVSAAAHREIEHYVSLNRLPVYKVVVQEQRELSTQIAEVTKIKHESPQVLVIDDGKVLTHYSHWDIEASKL